ncbi:putative Pentatricopeptide repeat-containing protein [Quillaja saponaria]|uniref:Pentatricopeptide repeat-containing protein n=1 Tax=Quillaja saponaria TaxID=32244 RepID=A0AAD7PTG8_QUISA|nr:putative Pentatricopeptide repeat-containing protein [Quillaja saponaria]
MLLHKSCQIIKPFSTSTTSHNWRTQIKQNQLALQISSILLQRHNWVPLLQRLNLSSKLTPSIFLQILQKTQNHPQTSLNFFNWAKVNLKFQPDPKSHCLIIQAAIGSGIYLPVKPLLDSLIQSHPAPVLVEYLVSASKGKDSLFNSLSFVLECYSNKGLFMEGLEVFRITRLQGFTPTLHACDALLDVLLRENKIDLAWCLCGSLIRSRLCLGQSTWSLVAQILGKNGKLDRIVRLLDSGIYNSMIYNLVIDNHCDKKDFEAAFDTLNEMCDRKLNPNLSTCSSILDGACKHGDVEVIERIMSIMVEKELLNCSLFDYDSIVQKLSNLGKTYAAERFFRRASDENIKLEDATYGYFLRALSKDRRINEAIHVYRVISKRQIAVDGNSRHAFVNVLLQCGEDQSEEVSELLKDVIRRGFCPSARDLSKYMTSVCNRGRWREAEDLLNLLLEKGLVPDSICCSSLMEHYCSCRQIDSAMVLHNKMEKLNVSLDVTTYNVLLNGLFKTRRIEEAVRVFDHMRRQNLLSSASFTVMIRWLCGVKELRKAMKLHDEMLKIGLKPDKATYKRLISGFK